MCLYCTKLAPIFKTNDVARSACVVKRNCPVRSEKAPRTGEYASNPERKNTPCISDLAGVEFLLKKERVFFFRGSALQVFGQCVRLQCGLGFAKTIFWGKGFGKTSAEFSRPQKGVWGMNAGGFRAGGFRKFGGYRI